MSKNNLVTDLKLVLNGISKVVSASTSHHANKFENSINNSSLLPIIKQIPELPTKILPNDIKSVQNSIERASMVPRSLGIFVQNAILPQSVLEKLKNTQKSAEDKFKDEEILVINEEDLEGIYIKSLGVEILTQNEDGKNYEKNLINQTNNNSNLSENSQQISQISHENQSTISENHKSNNNSSLDDKTIKKSNLVDDERIQKFMSDSYSSPPQNNLETSKKLNSVNENEEKKNKKSSYSQTSQVKNLKPLSKQKPESRLGVSSKERKVPATRLSRLVSYGGLAAGLGLGALTEVTKRGLGLKNSKVENGSILESSPFLTEANAERIVDTLCRVRGAALKLGQILSIQDNSMINPQLQKAFERVRHSADFMPTWQMEKMLQSELGENWRSKLSEFEDRPFAAASIGQVHLGKLKDGRRVAVKIQYPGVAQGIESDIDNLMAVLNIWSILPEGIFADNIIEVAKRELSWEVDYMREKNCAQKFKTLLSPYPTYYVPEVIDELTTKQIYTTELIEGCAVDGTEFLDQETRNEICLLMLELFFKELFEFRFMQTDPNWSNFLYNSETKQIGLLDFGASREYDKEFVDKYLLILKGAATDDRKLVLEASRTIGFLTGYESKSMESAHVETVMLLGEAFRLADNEPYDFGTQKITERIQELVPIMVQERLCPPPEQIYSLHRKISGVFLLCAKLKGKVKCRPIFNQVWDNYKFGPVSNTN